MVKYFYACLRNGKLYRRKQLALQCNSLLDYHDLRREIFEHAKSEGVFDGAHIALRDLEEEFIILATTNENEVWAEIHAEDARQKDFKRFLKLDFLSSAIVADRSLLMAIIPPSPIDNLPFVELNKLTNSSSFDPNTVNELLSLTLESEAPDFVKTFIQSMEKPRRISHDTLNSIKKLPSSPSEAAIHQCLCAASSYADKGLGQNEESFRLESFHYYTMLFDHGRGDAYEGPKADRELVIWNAFMAQLQRVFITRENHKDKGYLKFSTKSFPQPWKVLIKTPAKVKVQFRPSPDAQFWRGHQILWMSEIYSENSEDETKLNLVSWWLTKAFAERQAKNWVLPRIYFPSKCAAELWYLFWDQDSDEIHYVSAKYDLLSQDQALQFLRTLYNLSDRKAEFHDKGKQIAEQLYLVDLASVNSTNRSKDGNDGSGGVQGPGGRNSKGPGGKRDGNDRGPGDKRWRDESNDAGRDGNGNGAKRHKENDLLILSTLQDNGYTDASMIHSRKTGRHLLTCRKAAMSFVAKVDYHSSEFTILRFLQETPHPNVINPEQLFEHCGWFFAVLPCHTPLTDEITCRTLPLANGLIEGLSFLHVHGIAHLDLNPGNLVYTSQEELKIIDFDLAIRARQGDRIFGLRGTRGWMALEVEQNDGRDGFEPFKADLFSCGRILSFLDCSSRYSLGTQLVDTASDLMAVDPEKRPSLQEIKAVINSTYDVATFLITKPSQV